MIEIILWSANLKSILGKYLNFTPAYHFPEMYSRVQFVLIYKGHVYVSFKSFVYWVPLYGLAENNPFKYAIQIQHINFPGKLK